MNVRITGLVSTDGTQILYGTDTKFKIELRPNDTILIGLHTTHVVAILDNTTLLMSAQFTTSANQPVFITSVNPAYLLQFYDTQYTTTAMSLGNRCDDNHLLYGAQVFSRDTNISLSTLDYDKAVVLPEGYDYVTPFDGMSMVTATTGLTTLSVYVPTTTISTIAGSNAIRYVSGDTNVLLVGMCITIQGIKYTITLIRQETSTGQTRWLNTTIYLDNPVSVTYNNVQLLLYTNFQSMFPIGSYILINGKLHIVTGSYTGIIQVRYPISNSAVITVRKPLMATQTGKNTISFFNTQVVSTLLQPGNTITVQDIHSEDFLYQVNACYTETKHIARKFNDNSIVTVEEHKMLFIGIVCIGIPNYGFDLLPMPLYCNGFGFTSLEEYSLDYMLSVGMYLSIDSKLVQITDIYSQFNAKVNGVIPVGFIDIRVAKIGVFIPVYTDIVQALMLKFVASIIATNIIKYTTVIGLMKEYLSEWSFACMTVILHDTIWDIFNPLYLSINEYAAPPIPIEISGLVEKHTLITPIEITSPVIYHCGLPLTSKG